MTDRQWRTAYLATLFPLLLAVLCAAHGFDEVVFKPLTFASVVDVATPLFMIALFLERTQEVFISAWRRIREEELASHRTRTKEELRAAEDGLATLQGTSSASGDLESTQSTIDTLRNKSFDAEDKLTRYKSETSRAAFLVGITAGILVAIVGVRVLHPLIDADSRLDGLQGVAFDSLDILITGGLLGGGSEGIHKAVSVVTDFLDATREKLKS